MFLYLNLCLSVMLDSLMLLYINLYLSVILNIIPKCRAINKKWFCMFIKLHYKEFITLFQLKLGELQTPTVTVKCRMAIKVLFRYFNLCLSVMLDSLLCSFTSISFPTKGDNSWFIWIITFIWYTYFKFLAIAR
jgi:hypothetical protein